MTVSLARKLLLHDWRQFLPSLLAIGFSSLLLLMQAALVLGIFGSAGVYVSGSGADIWVGYPGTQSVDQGRVIDGNISAILQMDPDVTRVEQFLWLSGDWRGTGDTGNVSVFVSGIDSHTGGLMFSKSLSPELRQLLDTPDSVIVDRAELSKLGAKIGSHAFINGQRVRVVGVSSGLRALGGVNIVTSLETARRLNGDAPHPSWPTYLIAKLRDPNRTSDVVKRLGAHPGFGRYEAWSADAFALRSILFWMFETGAGAGVLFLTAVVFLVGAVISSQTLVGAVMSSVREYATLNALGIGMSALRWVVLEQAFWIGAVGVISASVLAALLIEIAKLRDVPVAFNLQVSLACLFAVLTLAAISGIAALNSLRRADPAVLLR